jgi:hypothetical protein
VLVAQGCNPAPFQDRSIDIPTTSNAAVEPMPKHESNRSNRHKPAHMDQTRTLHYLP